jgi:hypothetical protein
MFLFEYSAVFNKMSYIVTVFASALGDSEVFLSLAEWLTNSPRGGAECIGVLLRSLIERPRFIEIA